MPREADVPYFNYRSGGSEQWREGAACGPIGTKHPWTATGPGSRPALALGKEICLGICPVREQCLAYAISAEIGHGTWGGMLEDERRKMPERNRSAAVFKGRMMLYDGAGSPRVKEYRMVVVIARTKFVPHLAPGEVGEVEDPLARAAVRNGYADLVGNIENYDEWMYEGAELIVSGRTMAGNAAEVPPGKAGKKMVEAPVTLEETA